MQEMDVFQILFNFATGLSKVEELGFLDFDYPLEESKVCSITEKLLVEGLIEKKEGFQVTRKGLLELSRRIAGLTYESSKYSSLSTDGQPFYQYRSKMKKVAITHPDLSFEPAASGIDSEQLIYETQLSEINFDVDTLEVIYNLLFETDYLHPTGFWLVTDEKRHFCGWGIENLRRTLEITKMPLDLYFVIAFQTFIILVKSALNLKGYGKMVIKIYISRAIFPYIDSFDFLEERLKPFLLFNKIIEIPRGKEIKLKKPTGWKSPYPSPKFDAKVLGKIFHSGEKPQYDTFPYVFSLSFPEGMDPLSSVSPWFITCPGGCIDEDFKRLHRIHSFQILSLSEIDLVSLMINLA